MYQIFHKDHFLIKHILHCFRLASIYTLFFVKNSFGVTGFNYNRVNHKYLHYLSLIVRQTCVDRLHIEIFTFNIRQGILNCLFQNLLFWQTRQLLGLVKIVSLQKKCFSFHLNFVGSQYYLFSMEALSNINSFCSNYEFHIKLHIKL